MAKSKATKSPNDYPLFGYRVLPHIKNDLVERVDEQVRRLNRLRRRLDKPLKKNDVFVRAVEIGLATISKRGDL